MDKWINPYKNLDSKLKTALKTALKRNNGLVTEQDFNATILPEASPATVKHLKNRLFHLGADEKLEWNQKWLKKEQIAALSSNKEYQKAINLEKLENLFITSRLPHKRTQYPYVAPSSLKSRLTSIDHPRKRAVIGINTLVRPECTFSNGSGSGKNTTNNTLTVGEEEIILALHGTFNETVLAANENPKPRLILGEKISKRHTPVQIARTLRPLTAELEEPLRKGDWTKTAQVIAKNLNNFAEYIVPNPSSLF